jgi:hypothetical protein
MNDLTDDDWGSLLDSIEDGQCTPFLGAGASTPWLPLGDALAKSMSERFGVLYDTEEGLPRVAQIASHLVETLQVRRFVEHQCRGRQPDFSDPQQLHGVLAMLPLRYYVTTNYDDFMSKALLVADRPPITEVCQWHEATWNQEPPAVDDQDSRAREASEKNPLVFHLHGSFADRKSMVLTEDDYLDFLTTTTTHAWLLPKTVKKAFSQKLMFLGYALEDVTFKVALRKLGSQMRHIDLGHLTVQLERASQSNTEIGRQRRKVQLAMIKRLLGEHAKIYWGTCEEFGHELYARWTARHPPKQLPTRTTAGPRPTGSGPEQAAP